MMAERKQHAREKETMIKATPKNGDSAVIVDTTVQSVVEDLMTLMGYGCHDYILCEFECRCDSTE